MPKLYYHCSRSLYAPGDTILPGSWGRLILGIGPRHHRFYAEYLIERIRTTEFPEKPSRMASAFAFEDAGYAGTFAQQKRDQVVEYVYAVQPADSDTPLHRGDMSWIDELPNYRTFAGVEEVARRYWRGDERDPRAWEMVMPGPLRIIDRLSATLDNGISPAAPQSP